MKPAPGGLETELAGRESVRRQAQVASWARMAPMATSLALFAGLALLFCARPLTSPQVYYYGDISRAHFAFHTEIARQLRAGHLPLWTDRIFGGFPLLAEGQGGVYYPPNLIYTLPWVPLPAALKVSVCLHFFLAAAFTYLLARRIGLGLWPARFAAISFGFSGYMATRVIHQNVHHAAVWLPLTLFFVAAAQQAARGRRHVFLLLAAAAVGIQALAFYPPLTFYSLLAVLGWCLWPVGRGALLVRRLPGGLATFALVAGTGLALAAAQVLPTLELLRHSPRAAAGGYEYVTNVSLPLKQLPTLVLPNLFGSPATDDYWGAPNHWELCGYLGVLPLCLAFLALAARPRSPMTGYFAALALFGLAMALGPANPFYRLVPYLPGFNLFKAPARYLYLYSFAVAMLGGGGLQALLEGPGAAARRRVAGVVALTAGILSGTAAFAALLLAPRLRELAATRILPQLYGAEGRTRPWEYYHEQFARKWDPFFARRLEDLVVLAALGVLVGLILWLADQHRRGGPTAAPGWLAPTLTVLAVVDLFRFGAAYSPLIEPSYYTSAPAMARAAADDEPPGTGPPGTAARVGRSTPADDGPHDPGRPPGPGPRRPTAAAPYRVWRVGTDAWERAIRAGHSGWGGSPAFEFKLREALPWNLNLFDRGGLRLLDGGAALPPTQTEELAKWADAALARPSSPEARRAVAALAAMNVGYLVSPLDLTPLGCRRLHSTAGLNLYRVPEPSPRVFLAAAPSVSAFAPSVTQFGEPSTASTARSGIEASRPVAPQAGPLLPQEDAWLVPDRFQDPSTIKVQAVCAVPRLLVVLERSFPGWQCRIDGRSAAIVPTASLGMGVVVPAGTHRLIFRYRPASTHSGLFVSLLTLAGVLGAVVVLLRPAAREPGPRQAAMKGDDAG
jgi:hypothetical protein